MAPKTDSISFSSEALLQQAIAGLLIRMPSVSGVQILQGALELGKDIIFYTHGGFAEQILCACVVKNSKITGEIGTSQGARTVYLQASQAFDTPYVNEGGNEIPIERVYVITPFEISPSAVQSIRGQLKERSGQIVFMGRPKLFDLLKLYWPDYLADEADVLEHHLARLDERLDEDHPLPGLAVHYNLGSVERYIKRIYIPQSFSLEIHQYSVANEVERNLTPFLLDMDWSFDRLSTEEEIKERRRRLVVFLGTLNRLKGIIESLQLEGKEVIDNVESYLKAILTGLETSFIKRPQSPDIHQTPEFRAELRKERLRLISMLTGIVTRINQSVSTIDTDTLEALNSESFSTYRAFDSWAYWNPTGLFELSTKRIRAPKDIMNKSDRSFLIVGAPGFGKTSFCRWHALQDTEMFNAGKSNFLPVYVPLHKLSRKETGSFEETFLGNLRKSALLTRGLGHKGAPGATRVRLYLDGLDEIPSEEKRKEVITLANVGSKGDRRYQVIVTARDHVDGDWLSWLTRISLNAFDNEDITDFTDGWLGKQTEQVEAFNEQLRASPGLAALMRIPLLATLIVLVFRRTRKLPESKIKLYEIFIDLLSGGWDTAKGILRTTRFGQRVKLMVLTSLASEIHSKQRREFGNDEIRDAIQVRTSSLADDWKTLRNELLDDGLIVKSGSVVQFSHLSFQEFLAAKDYSSDFDPSRIKNVIAAFVNGKDWWRGVVEFYIGLSVKPRETTRWILSTFAPYNAVGSPGRQRLQQIIRSVRESFPEFTAEDFSDHKVPDRPRSLSDH